jgi:plastocyanin
MTRTRHAVLLAAIGALVVAAAPAGAANAPVYPTVGSGFTISLNKKSTGTAKVTSLKPGTYKFVVRDRSKMHNFHLTGPGVNKTTTVAFVGTKTWTITLKKGTYRFVCDPHKESMKGSFKVA